MRLVGRYKVREEAGRGAMGVVLRAEDPGGRSVALKLLKSGQDAGPGPRGRFLREVQALLRVRHPNVVALLDAGEQEGVPFIAMEWVDGETLQDQLARVEAFHPEEAARIVAKLARALVHCHDRGVLHRDLKPSNVLVRALDGEVLLTDFGLARDFAPEGHGSSSADLDRLTATGKFLGTPGYWPPEQARGQTESIGPRSDVWGLGALLYALLTGEPPAGSDDLAVALAALENDPPPPSKARPTVPAALDRICARSLVIDPARRYPSAEAMAADLEAWLANPGGRRVPLRLIAVALLLALAAVAVLFLTSAR